MTTDLVNRADGQVGGAHRHQRHRDGHLAGQRRTPALEERRSVGEVHLEHILVRREVQGVDPVVGDDRRDALHEGEAASAWLPHEIDVRDALEPGRKMRKDVPRDVRTGKAEGGLAVLREGLLAGRPFDVDDVAPFARELEAVQAEGSGLLPRRGHQVIGALELDAELTGTVRGAIRKRCRNPDCQAGRAECSSDTRGRSSRHARGMPERHSTVARRRG